MASNSNSNYKAKTGSLKSPQTKKQTTSTSTQKQTNTQKQNKTYNKSTTPTSQTQKKTTNPATYNYNNNTTTTTKKQNNNNNYKQQKNTSYYNNVNYSMPKKDGGYYSSPNYSMPKNTITSIKTKINTPIYYTSNINKYNTYNSNNIELFNIETGTIENLKIKVEDIDLSRISASAYNAQNSDFVKVNEAIWKSADLNITEREDGTFLIKNGDVPIGFTDEKGLDSLLNGKNNETQKTDEKTERTQTTQKTDEKTDEKVDKTQSADKNDKTKQNNDYEEKEKSKNEDKKEENTTEENTKQNNEQKWTKSDDCGAYRTTTGTGILGTFENNDKTFNSYCQGAGSWSNKSLRGGKSFADVGCAATAISTIMSGYVDDFTPNTFIANGSKSMKETAHDYGCQTKDLNSHSEIMQELEKGNQVIYKISKGGKVGDIQYKNNQHYVALLGVNDEGKVFLSDPGSTHNDGYYDLDNFSGLESAFSVSK